MAKVNCPKCGARIDFHENPSLKRGKCEYCEHVFDLPELVPPVPLARPIDPIEPQRSSSVGTLAVVGVLVLAAIGGVVWTFRRGSAPTPTPVPTPSEPTSTPTTPPVPAPTADAAPPLADAVLTFGGKGTGPGQMDRAKWITVASDGTIWTVDLPNRVQAFDATGKWLRTLQPTTTNQGDGPLEDDVENVEGIAVDRKGRVWVSIGFDLVALSGTDGVVVKKIAMQRPDRCFMHLSIDASDTLYASSNCAKQDVHGIFVVDANKGTVVHRFAEPNNFEKATDGKIGVDAKGNLYCPHMEERNIHVLDRNGKTLRTFSGLEASDVVGNIAVDGAGRVFVRSFDHVEVFDDQIRPLGTIDPPKGTALDVAIGPEGDLYLLTSESQVVRMHMR